MVFQMILAIYCDLWQSSPALKFLLDEVLTYPKWLFDTEVGEYTYLLRNTPLGVVENAPTQVLKNAHYLS